MASFTGGPTSLDVDIAMKESVVPQRHSDLYRMGIEHIKLIKNRCVSIAVPERSAAASGRRTRRSGRSRVKHLCCCPVPCRS